MSQAKLFTQLIKSLEDLEFDKLAKLYLNEIDDVRGIINCNGPYDSGMDIRSINISEIEVQYQITTRENKFDKKLYEDLKKAKSNVDKYGLPNKVRYFYSYPLTNSAILGFKKEAKATYSIVLDIIEANTISAVAEEYEAVKDFLYNLTELSKYKNNSNFFDDARVKAFYDLMSFGSSTDIKYNIIKSFVLNYLYQQGSNLSTEVLAEINRHFNAHISDTYFEIFCRRMSTERRIVFIKPASIGLTESENTRIKEVLKKYNTEEALLQKEVHDILKDYGLQSFADKIIHKLSEIYQSNYAINLSEFTNRNSSISDLQTCTKNLNEYIKLNIKGGGVSEDITKRLIAVTDANEILARIAIGQVYSKVNDPERLQEYVTRHNNNKDIFLDTNVIINALLVHYAPDVEYDEPQLKIAKQFLEFTKKNHLNLKTIRPYVLETANIFKNALEIIPFTHLPVFGLLGKTNNIVYNHYLYLKNIGYFESQDTSFENFLKEFKFQKIGNIPDYNYYPQIDYLLKSLEVSSELPPKYELLVARQLLSEDIRDFAKRKSSFAMTNDAIMLMRLGDNDVDINPIDPIFCTWDTSLMRVRKKFFTAFPNCTEWLMYTPTRMMDHYSMMNFQVKQGTLTNEVLSILDKDFDFQTRTQSLLDSMLTIINPKDEVGLRYTNKFAEIRQNETIQIDYKADASGEDSADNKPLDIVFDKLFINYATQSEDGTFDAFKRVFTKQEYFDEVINVLMKEIEYVNANSSISNELFPTMDEIIKKSKQTRG
jgi:hypothetical protein